MAYYEPGMYLCRIVGQGFGVSKNDNEMFTLTILPIAQIEGSQRNSISGEYTRTASLWLNSDTNVAGATSRIESFCPEWDGTFKSLHPDDDNFTDLSGKEVELRCYHKEGSDGKVYDNFDFPRQANEDTPVQSDADVATRLDRLYGKTTKKKATKEVAEVEAPF